MSATAPPGWEEASLSDLGVWSGGGTPSKGVAAYWGGDVPWLSPKDMKAWRLRGTADHITTLALQEGRAQLLTANSVAFVVRSGILSHTLPVAIVPFETTVNQDMRVLTPTPSLNPEWLLYAILAHADDIRQRCQKDGTTVASIEVDQLQAYRILVPPRLDQDRIAEVARTLLADLADGEERFAGALARLPDLRAAVLASGVRGDLVEVATLSSGRDLRQRVLADREQRWETHNVSRRGRRYPEPQSPLAGPFDLPEHWSWATIDELAADVQYGSSAKTGDDATGVPVLGSPVV